MNKILKTFCPWSFLCFAIFAFPLLGGNNFSFEENRGQTAASVNFLAHTSGGVVFVTSRGIALRGAGQLAFAFELAAADLSTKWQPESPNGETISYFVGRDPSKWVKDAPKYRRLARHNVYPGIDLSLYGNDRQLEYDFMVAPYADPSRIRLYLTDAAAVFIDMDGSLVVKTRAGILRHRKPILTETLTDGSHRPVTGAFRLIARTEVGFTVGPHDPALPLSIDPVLESSTYFGGHGDEQVVGTDGNGDFVGMSSSIDVPGASFSRRKGTNLFVRQGQQTIVVGCSGNITVTSSAFSSADSRLIVVGGFTDCLDLPTNLGATGAQTFQPGYGGGATDGFVMALNLASAPQQYSLTYVGGPGDDRVNATAVSDGFVVVAGSTEGGLPQSIYNTGFQLQPAGGLDGFLIGAYSSQIGLLLSNTTYLGGTGDDTILGLTMSQGNCYVTGETKSSDFPLVNSSKPKLDGASDAFVAIVAGCNQSVTSSILFGGSGDDRGTAVALSNGNIIVAGVTSSSDLPLKNPTQRSYGGGASDAFIAEFGSDLSTLVSSTYMGGSEADEATSVVSNYPNTVFVGGWTASANFPTVNALQPKYGGGPDDGFLVHLDDDGSVYEATYFGGSGSDRVLNLSTGFPNGPFSGNAGPTVWLTGTTTSPNLPTKNPNQANLAGPSDGFVAEIDTNLFTVPASLSGGYDLRSFFSIYISNPDQSLKTTFTATSSDPSTVQVSADPATAGQKSASLVPSGNGRLATFYVDCLKNSGGADLTVSGAEYPTRTTHVTCFGEALRVLSTFPFEINIGGSQSPFSYSVGFNLTINDPNTFGPPVGPRPGAAPVTVQIMNSNPSVLALSNNSIPLTNGSGNVGVSGLAIGGSDLTFDTGGIPVVPANPLHVVVGGSFLSGSPSTVASGFESAIYLQGAQGSLTTKIPTVVSQDPSRVLLSLDPTRKGSSSVTLSEGPTRTGIWVQAVGSSGDVSLKIQVAGEPDVIQPVHIVNPEIELLSTTNTVHWLQLPLGNSTAVAAFVPYATYLNPSHAPITLTLQSSVAGIAKISPSSLKLSPGAPWGNFQITTLKAGSTVLSFSNSANIPNSDLFPSLTLNVANSSLRFPDVEVGKNLQTAIALTLPTPAKSDIVVTATVGDATLALLSPDGNGPGFPQVETIIRGGQSAAYVFVYGIGSSGQTKVTAVVPGYPTATANVTLDRSGFFWSLDSETTSIDAGSDVISGALLVGPLDAATGYPVGVQPLQPGLMETLQIANSNPKVATISQNTITYLQGANLVVFPASVGATALTVQQPAGFSAPALRTKLVVNVIKAQQQLSISPGPVAGFTQIPLIINAPQNASLTITTSDPSKAVLSTDLNKSGSHSITVKNQIVYLQALATTGSVTVKVSSSGLPDASASYTLTPPGLGISLTGPSNQLTYQNGKYVAIAQLKSINVAIQAQYTFIPGLKLSAMISSSNAKVATVTGSPLSIPAPSQPFATVTVNPAALGETTISIAQPAGFSSVGQDSVVLDVATPSVRADDVTVAKDTITVRGLSIPVAATADLTVTLTSSDPSKILLSPDATSSPKPSIQVVIPAGSLSASFYIQAYSDKGAATVGFAAPGYANSTSNVQLTPLAFGFGQPAPGPVRTAIQGPPQMLYVSTTPASFPYILRPGVASLTLKVVSSDPTIVSVDKSEIVFTGTINSVSINCRALKTGTAMVSLTAPPGYSIDRTTGHISIQADEGNINLTVGNPPPFILGKDLQTRLGFTLEGQAQSVSVTAKSSNASALLISPDGVQPGQASVNVMQFGNQGILQALASSGTVTVTLSAAGYHSATLPVMLAPTGAIFQTGSEQQISMKSGAAQYPIALAALNPVNLQPASTPVSPRPGVTFTIPVTSSDPKIVAVTTPTVTVSSANSNIVPQIGIQPVSPGTAVITLGSIAGGPSPASGNQILIVVTN